MSSQSYVGRHSFANISGLSYSDQLTQTQPLLVRMLHQGKHANRNKLERFLKIIVAIIAPVVAATIFTIDLPLTIKRAIKGAPAMFWIGTVAGSYLVSLACTMASIRMT